MLKLIVPEKYWHRLFEFSIFLKAFNGVWETVTGALFLSLSRQVFYTWVYSSIQDEIIESPSDLVTKFLTHVLRGVSSDVRVFAAIYLLLHGILNIFLSIQLYRGRYWAYLVTMGVTGLFMLYQIHRVILHHSIFLTLLTVFDAVYIVLTWHEYKRHILLHLNP